jgi:hypothetical protein
LCAGPPGAQPGERRVYAGIPPREGFRLRTDAHWALHRDTRCTGRCRRVETGLPVKSPVTPGWNRPPGEKTRRTPDLKTKMARNFTSGLWF